MTVTTFLDPADMPARSQDQTTFDAKMGGVFQKLPQFGAELNQTGVDANAAAAAAANSATAASSAAAAASASAGALPFNPATNYGSNMPAAISLLDGKVYRRKTAGISSTDPKNDGTNWFLSIDTLTMAQAVAVSLYF